MYKLIRLNVVATCRSDILGNEIDLPATPELEEAIMIINSYCSTEVRKRKRQMRDKFILDQFVKIEKSTTAKQLRDILEETIEYGKNER